MLNQAPTTTLSELLKDEVTKITTPEKKIEATIIDEPTQLETPINNIEQCLSRMNSEDFNFIDEKKNLETEIGTIIKFENIGEEEKNNIIKNITEKFYQKH